MSTKSKTSVEEGTPTYLESGDPVRRRPDGIVDCSASVESAVSPACCATVASSKRAHVNTVYFAPRPAGT
jgi:hypothetical protein